MVINPIVGVCIPIIRIPIKGGMTIPNIATFDHGTYVFFPKAIYMGPIIPFITIIRRGPHCNDSLIET